MAHFDSVISTLGYAIEITRKDGVQLGMTSLNFDFVIDGVTYFANSAVEPTAVTQKVNLSTDNISIKALVDNNLITPVDLLNNVYEEASVICAFIDFTNFPTFITDGIILLKGRVGKVTVEDTFYTFEVRSLSEELNKPVSFKTSTQCPYDFGDTRCKKDLVADSLLLTGINIVSGVGNILTLDIALSAAFVSGVITFTSGILVGRQYEIADITGGTLVELTQTFPGNAAGSIVTATAFCAKTEAACIFYANQTNFGGFKVGGNFIPGLTKITVVK